MLDPGAVACSIEWEYDVGFWQSGTTLNWTGDGFQLQGANPMGTGLHWRIESYDANIVPGILFPQSGHLSF
jgi:hypothetical protein